MFFNFQFLSIDLLDRRKIVFSPRQSDSYVYTEKNFTKPRSIAKSNQTRDIKGRWQKIHKASFFDQILPVAKTHTVYAKSFRHCKAAGFIKNV